MPAHAFTPSDGAARHCKYQLSAAPVLLIEVHMLSVSRPINYSPPAPKQTLPPDRGGCGGRRRLVQRYREVGLEGGTPALETCSGSSCCGERSRGRDKSEQPDLFLLLIPWSIPLSSHAEKKGEGELERVNEGVCE